MSREYDIERIRAKCQTGTAFTRLMETERRKAEAKANAPARKAAKQAARAERRRKRRLDPPEDDDRESADINMRYQLVMRTVG